jgi:hypothetical protein
MFVPATTNKGTVPTFQANSTAAHTITARGGQALSPADIVANVPAIVQYNLANTRWELLNPQGAGFTGYAQLTVTGLNSTVSGANAPTPVLTTGGGTIANCIYTVTGSTAVLQILPFGGLSTTATMTLTGLPAALTPARTQTFITPIIDNGVYATAALIQISGTTVTFGLTYPTAGGFTTSGAKGQSQGIIITYNLL